MAGYYSISDERLAEIATAAGLAVEDVREICTADWSEGQSHQDWLDDAPVAEIAEWASIIARDVDAAREIERAEAERLDAS